MVGGGGFLALMAKVTVWLVVLLCKTQISNVLYKVCVSHEC